MDKMECDTYCRNMADNLSERLPMEGFLKKNQKKKILAIYRG